jgi:uncharacterized protein
VGPVEAGGVPGERDLATLLSTMEPELHPGTYVFAVAPDSRLLAEVEPVATVREAEGLTVVLRREDADRAGLAYAWTAAWITLRVHSALDAVGFTSAFSTALAAAGMSCNVIAGHHHDHLFVPAERAGDAMRALTDLSARTSA